VTHQRPYEGSRSRDNREGRRKRLERKDVILQGWTKTPNYLHKSGAAMGGGPRLKRVKRNRKEDTTNLS